MSDNTSVIDAVRLLAKATKDDSAKLSDIVKGSLRPDQIDDMRLMLSRARDGSVTHGTATATASAAALPRDTSVQRGAWKGSSNKAAPSRPRVRAETPHPMLFATDAEVAAMLPEERASAPEAPARTPLLGGDREAVHGSGGGPGQPLQVLGTPRAPAPAPARPTATTAAANKDSERPSMPRLEERSKRRVAFDPRGPYPQPARAADRYQSKERKLDEKAEPI